MVVRFGQPFARATTAASVMLEQERRERNRVLELHLKKRRELHELEEMRDMLSAQLRSLDLCHGLGTRVHQMRSAAAATGGSVVQAKRGARVIAM